METIKVSVKTLEEGLIVHCAPTLAGIKCAGLFNYFYSAENIAREELHETNEVLNKKGVYVVPLVWKEKSVLIYVYRESMLQKELSNIEVHELLQSYGYDFGYKGNIIEQCIVNLKKRLAVCTCFPHEIGVFLGYPLEDVKGFIKNRGKNCKSCGVWKVYFDKEKKDKIFVKLNKCKDVYIKAFCEGRKIEKMTVSS